MLESFLLLPQPQLPLLIVGWTLVHEAYFYLVLTLAVALVPTRYVPAYLVAWGGLAMLGYAWLPASPTPWALLVTNPLTLEFIAGALIGHGWHRVPGALGRPLFALGAVALAGVMVVMGQVEQPAPFARVLLFGGSGALMVLGAARWEAHANVAFPRWLVAIGDSSYSLYLSHIFVLTAICYAWAKTGVTAPWWSHVLFAVVSVVACVGVGRLSYRLLEQPLLDMGRRFRGLPPLDGPRMTWF